MNRLETLRRYLVLFAGIFFIALGVSMFTKSGLGTSAISVIPLTLSLEFTQLSYGTWVALFNIFLVGLEWVMLRSAMPKREIVQQLFFALVFGSVVDLTMYLLWFLNPTAYWQRLAVVGASCFVMAFGVYLTLISRVGVMAGDGFARTLAGKIGKSFAFKSFKIGIFECPKHFTGTVGAVVVENNGIAVFHFGALAHDDGFYKLIGDFFGMRE